MRYPLGVIAYVVLSSALTLGSLFVSGMPAAALAAIAAMLLLLVGLRLGFSQALLLATFFMLPFNGVRVGEVAVADLTLFAAAVAAMAQYKNLSVPLPYTISLYTILVSASIGSFFSPFQESAIAAVLRLSVASIVCVLVVFLVRPTAETTLRWIWAFALGNATSVVYGIANPPEYSDRLNGLATHANTFGLVSIFAMLLLLNVRPSRNGVPLLAWAALLALSAGGALLSGSRAVLLAGLVGLILAAGLSAKPSRSWGALAVATLGIILPVFAVQVSVTGSAVQRLIQPSRYENQSNEGRVILAEYALERFSQSPFFGAGMDIAVVAHNVYLQLLTAAGPLALAAFVVIVARAVRGLISNRYGRAARIGGLALGVSNAVLTAVGAYVIAAAVSNNLWDRFIWLLLGLAMYMGTEAFRARAAEQELHDLPIQGRESTEIRKVSRRI